MQVFIYSRKSTGSSEQSISIDQQVDNCLKLAQEKKLTVTEIFREYSCSGRLFPPQLKSLAEMDLVYQQFLKETKKVGQERTQLGYLLDKLKTGDIIIVDDKTRFCRSLNGSYLENALIQILKSKNVKLISVKEGSIDFNSFTDQFVFNLQSSINSNQLETQRKKSKASLKRLKDAGEYSASLGTALGYKYSGLKREVLIDEKTAPIVKFTFKSYIEGMSLLKICREVNKNWGRKIVVKSIKNMLNRVEYTGYMFDSNKNLIDCKQTKNKELVTFNDWTLAQKILTSRKTNNVQPKKYPNHFVGLLKCSKCGSNLKVCINNGGRYFSFRCMAHTDRDQENCKINITSNTLYEHGLSLEDAVYPLLIISLVKKLQANPKQDQNKLEEKQVELNNLLNQEKTFTDLFMKGLLDNSNFESNLLQLKEKKSNLQQEIIQLEQQLKEDDSDQIRQYVSKIVNKKLTYEDYQQLLPYSIKQIKVFEDKISVETVEGEINIPRFKEHGILKLPEYTFKNTVNNWKIYYYKNTPNIYSKQIETLFKNNYISIYYIGG